MKKKYLSARELDVMEILWEEKGSLTASKILHKNSELNINTIQAALKSLLKKNYIKIDDIVYSGKVLTRSYKAIIDAGEYIKNNFSADSVDIIASLINTEVDTTVINELSALLQKRKDELMED